MMDSEGYSLMSSIKINANYTEILNIIKTAVKPTLILILEPSFLFNNFINKIPEKINKITFVKGHSDNFDLSNLSVNLKKIEFYCSNNELDNYKLWCKNIKLPFKCKLKIVGRKLVSGHILKNITVIQ